MSLIATEAPEYFYDEKHINRNTYRNNLINHLLFWATGEGHAAAGLE